MLNITLTNNKKKLTLGWGSAENWIKKGIEAIVKPIGIQENHKPNSERYNPRKDSEMTTKTRSKTDETIRKLNTRTFILFPQRSTQYHVYSRLVNKLYY